MNQLKSPYRSVRYIRSDDIAGLCRRNNFFTTGTLEEYATLLSFGYSHTEVDDDDLYTMASMIQAHSESIFSTAVIMGMLNDITHTSFEEIA